ncbi:MAG: VWA domain-containing protein [Rhodobacteraceae bacterium]|nr:MAG: VWA domain-containing protein [Paracoccaceae bacterium]
MTGLDLALDAFHFLRPLWLGALLPVVWMWWRIRSRAMHRAAAPKGLAPHLTAALTIGATAARFRLLPIDGIAMALALLATGAAGPTWSRDPDPFAAQSAPLVVVLKVSPSMESPDIAPSRLERSKQKIRDLLELRDGARTALVAYAGTAHLVVPMTEDPGVMLPYLEGLEPRIMPEGGNRITDALALAEDLLAREDAPGAILVVTDAIDPGQTADLATQHPVSVLAMVPEDQAGAMVAGPEVTVLTPTPDMADVVRIDRMLDAAHARALMANSAQPWRDRGVWLAWPAAFLLLIWFRRGWTMQWALIAAVVLLLPASQARADGVIDWFLTPDQQGRIAFERQTDFSRAADLFTDPLWRGYALYRSGRYEEAVTVLERIETAEAAFMQGMAHMKSRGYRDGVRAFETALARDPEYPGAADNLSVARDIVDYVERVREQSDTGEEMGIGADDVVFDNEAGKGADTQMEARETRGEAILTTEQWMNTVDTRTGDFLRSRFQLEVATATREGAGE